MEATDRIAGLERKWWVLLSIGVGTFMSALDGSIVNTVLPVIEHAFGSDVATIEWVLTTYLVVISGVLLGFGRLGDLRGHKSFYGMGFVVFVLGSGLCGAAPSALWLIGFRALQGLGAAMIMSNSPAILVASFPSQERGKALGLQATLTYLGLTLGPALGGWLTTAFSWRAVFYVNLPVGILALWMALKFIPKDEGSLREGRFDWAGAALFLVAIMALLVALDQGERWGWGAVPTLGLLAVSAALLVGFVRLELRLKAPMLDLRLFESRVFAGATASAVLNYLCLFATLFLLPFYLMRARGLSPAHTGLLLTIQPLVMAVAAPLAGARSDKIGTRIPTVAGMVVLAVGLWMLSRVGGSGDLVYFEVALGVVGLGIGVFISPNNSAMLGAAPKTRQGIASGVLATARNVGMVLGVALGGAVYASITSSHPGAAGVVHSLQVGMWGVAGLALLGALISAIR